MSTIIHGDCLDILPTLDADSIDAIVTDPPYGLSFMGRDWDHGVPGERFWTEMLRVAKPGAHLLAFGGTRTYHRLACAIEDAGWEVRDCLVWAYASGFPKSHDVSKAMDKAAGETRGRPRSSTAAGEGFDPKGSLVGRNVTTQWCDTCGRSRGSQPANCKCNVSGDPVTDLAREWQGWGTALKPAWEPIILARKPMRGTVAANVTEYGTGALNIDGCRIGYVSDAERAEVNARTGPNSRHRPQLGGGTTGAMSALGERHVEDVTSPLGRWPANLILTDPLFDGGVDGTVPGYGDSGTYSRFFLIPKASRSDREPKGEHGLVARQARIGNHGNPTDRPGDMGSDTPRANTHPTVKPTALMRHLVRLVTPPGGTVLDPFLGSGTTALACEEEGFDCIGIEREAEYVRIAEARLAGSQRGLGIA